MAEGVRQCISPRQRPPPPAARSITPPPTPPPTPPLAPPPTTPATCGTVSNTASYSSTNGGSGSSGAIGITVTCPTTNLAASAACSGSNLVVNITAGDAGFSIVGSGPGLPTSASGTGSVTL